MKNSMLAISVAMILVVMGCGDSGPTSVDFDSFSSGGDYAPDAASWIAGPVLGYENEFSEGPVEGEGDVSIDPIEGEWRSGELTEIGESEMGDEAPTASFDLTNPNGDDAWGTGELSFDSNDLSLRVHGLVESSDVEYGVYVYYFNPDYSASAVVGVDADGNPTDRFSYETAGQLIQGTWDDPFGPGTIVDRIEVVEYDHRGNFSEEIVLSASIIWDHADSGSAGSGVD